MLTIFSTPKPFEGHVGVIQRNALKSWTLLHPDCEVILLGDESGTAEAARDFGIRHVPQVDAPQDGAKSILLAGALAPEAGESCERHLVSGARGNKATSLRPGSSPVARVNESASVVQR